MRAAAPLLSLSLVLSLASSCPADGPVQCKTEVDISPRIYASADGRFGVKMLPRQERNLDADTYEYATRLVVFQLAGDGVEQVESETVLNVLPIQVLVSTRGDVVFVGHHGPLGDAGVQVTIYDKTGIRRGAAEFGEILGPLSGAERNLAFESLLAARSASFQYDYYSRSFVVLPISPNRTVRIALDDASLAE